MRKLSTLMIALTTVVMLPQAALASAAQTPAHVCLSNVNMFTDGVDLFHAKLAQRRAAKTGSAGLECTPAHVFMNGGSNGTDGVDHFQERMDPDAAANPGSKARVYLSKGNDGTDGVDLFQRHRAGDS
ncbi:hypothetical protein [Oceanimonas smirnovii]|uniref:hypothetical protein n=1 Tax=Oceanimonas smirnovii TaxID=264574 RepID=UPI00376FA096